MDIFFRWAKSLSWRHYGYGRVGYFIVGLNAEKQKKSATKVLEGISGWLQRGAFGGGMRGALRVPVWEGGQELITTDKHTALRLKEWVGTRLLAW